MRDKIKLYYNGWLIESNWTESLSRKIFETMQVGDECILYPFNFLGDENREFLGKKLEYHDKPLCLARIERCFIHTVNDSTRIEFSYFLEDQLKTK